MKSRGTAKLKTKTHFVTELLEDTNYLRKPANFICQYQSVVHARALIMGRFHMLKCANNFSTGFGSKLCAECNIIDSDIKSMPARDGVTSIYVTPKLN